jgi:hypothetical protein
MQGRQITEYGRQQNVFNKILELMNRWGHNSGRIRRAKYKNG